MHGRNVNQEGVTLSFQDTEGIRINKEDRPGKEEGLRRTEREGNRQKMGGGVFIEGQLFKRKAVGSKVERGNRKKDKREIYTFKKKAKSIGRISTARELKGGLLSSGKGGSTAERGGRGVRYLGSENPRGGKVQRDGEARPRRIEQKNQAARNDRGKKLA